MHGRPENKYFGKSNSWKFKKIGSNQGLLFELHSKGLFCGNQMTIIKCCHDTNGIISWDVRRPEAKLCSAGTIGSELRIPVERGPQIRNSPVDWKQQREI